MVRTQTLPAGLLLAALAAGCGSGPRETAQAETSPTETSRPSESTPSPGTRFRLELRTHCGVVSASVGGVLWLADPRLGDHNPPSGWDESRTPGSLSILTDDRAEFVGDQGQRAMFRRAPAGTPDPLDGCN